MTFQDSAIPSFTGLLSLWEAYNGGREAPPQTLQLCWRPVEHALLGEGFAWREFFIFKMISGLASGVR